MIYFVQSADGLIKIGTTSNLERRLSTMRVDSPSELKLLGTLAGGRKIEAALHSRFAEDRKRGEWFAPSSSLLGFISDHATAVPGDLVCLERDPAVDHTAESAVATLGAQIRRARLRRKITASDLSMRAGISRDTFSRLESGDSGIGVGIVARVLNELGLLGDLATVAANDEVGREIADKRLDPVQRRQSK
jgi:hypothetical protein